MTGWDVIVVSIFISIHICFFRDYRSAHVKRKMIASDQHSKIGSILPSSLRDFIEGVLFRDPLRIDPRWSQCQSWVSSWSIWGQIESYPQFAKNISTQQGAFVNQNISKHGPCSETNTGWWFEPLWKNISQLGWLFPIYGKIKNGNQTTNQNKTWNFWLVNILIGIHRHPSTTHPRVDAAFHCEFSHAFTVATVGAFHRHGATPSDHPL